MAATSGSPGGQDAAPIPSRDFVLSCTSPLVAALARVLAPEALDPYTRVVWLLGLVPIFLLTRHRGWWGAAVGLLLSGGTVVLAELFAAGSHGHVVAWPVIGAVVVSLAAVALGVGSDWQWWSQRRAAEAKETSGRAAPSTVLERTPDRVVTEFLLGKAFSGAKREPPLAIVLVEIDRLEEYARLYGRESADRALVLLAEALGRHTRSMNVFGRFRGHSCLVILQGEDLVGAHAFALRILEEMEAYPAPWKGRVHLNAGVAGFEPGLADAGELLAGAEKALETARGMGGSACVVFVGRETPEPTVPGMIILRPGGQVKEVHRAV